MTDDLEQRLTRALAHHVDGASADFRARPPAGAVVATARRRRARRRALVAGAAAVALLAATGVVRAWSPGDDDAPVEVAASGGLAPVATTAVPGPRPTTTTVAATTTAPPISYGAPAPVTTPQYQPLTWFPVVDGVEVAWQAEDGGTTTWTRSGAQGPRVRGTEGALPTGHVVPTGRALVVVVFEGTDGRRPAQAAVGPAGAGADPVWVDLTWVEDHAVAWARVPGSGDAAPADDPVVALR